MTGEATESNVLEAHRVALTGHCYRMLGSLIEADDAVQETMLRAWRSLDQFEGRSSLRTWLYRIATNVCLDALANRSNRVRPVEMEGPGTPEDELSAYPGSHWLEPAPAACVIPTDADPARVAILKESVRLAYVAALQRLPPKQRAALILAEVLDWSGSEIAAALDTSEAAANSALQRARKTMASRAVRPARPLDERQRQLVDRFVEAFERYDPDALAALLCEDVKFSMPPYALWLQGPEAVRTWLSGRGIGCRGSRLVRVSKPGSSDGQASSTEACEVRPFGQYRARPEGGWFPWALVVLELSDEGVAEWTSFLDVETLFPRFGLPSELPPSG